MATNLFINLPVADLQKAMDFYTKIGFANNPQFSDNTGACMFYKDAEFFIMLLTHPKFKEFTTKKISDPKTNTTVFHSFSVESNDRVNQIVSKAIEAGGTEPSEPKDYGFMQKRSFEDLDGHLWGVLYMDMSKLPG
ncbi:VOC family protein [Flavobacterium sp. '19STA2R22 D10 B1']|uniref:VOC family protein n=1 Tax=Flavobacterium aerium TaxID=3037261 RepID=UPI00278BC132|nr:VOC family protein [Flavobacterium sp. '19STA2R22 D10 B1']